MRVVTWNIEHGIDIDGAVGALTTHDRLKRADVLLLQEMDELGTKTVASELGFHYVYASSGIHPKTGRDFGNAILTPTVLENRTVIELPHKARLGGRARLAITATSHIEGAELTLASAHTEIPALGWSKRQEQFATISGTAREWKTRRAIVGGDFNTVSRKSIQALIDKFESDDFLHVSTDAVATLRRVGQNFTLDHLFAKGLSAIESGVVRGLSVSDHAPVWSTLEPARDGAR